MAFSQLSAAGEDAVCTFNKATEDEGGIHPTRTHHADGAQVGGVLKAGHTCCIGGCITAPVAEETQNSRIEIVHYMHLKGVDSEGWKHSPLPDSCRNSFFDPCCTKGSDLVDNLLVGKPAHHNGKTWAMAGADAAGLAGG